MKMFCNKAILILFACLMVLTGFSQSKFVKNESVEQVSRSFIKSFQLENYDALFELFPPKDEVIALHKALLKNGPEKDTILMNLENAFTPRINNYYESEFKRILAKGKKVEVDWKRLKVINVEYDIESDGAYARANPTYLTCKNKGTIYTIQINSVKINGGWYVLPLIDGQARLGYWADPIKLKVFRANRKAIVLVNSLFFLELFGGVRY